MTFNLQSDYHQSVEAVQLKFLCEIAETASNYISATLFGVGENELNTHDDMMLRCTAQQCLIRHYVLRDAILRFATA